MSNHIFKEGDRVRSISTSFGSFGKIGTVICKSVLRYGVEFDVRFTIYQHNCSLYILDFGHRGTTGKCLWLSDTEIELVKEENSHQEEGDKITAKYIDAGKISLFNGICKSCSEGLDFCKHRCRIPAAMEIVAEAPVEDVEPVIHGTWIAESNPAFSPFDGSPPVLYICSRCGLQEDKKYQHCHCGAKMDEEVSHE